MTIRYDEKLIYRPQLVRPLKPHYACDKNVVILKLFPGITEAVVSSVLHTPGLRGVVLETFGSGNAPTDEWFLKQFREATERGIVVVNVTQCTGGCVEMHRYEVGRKLLECGVLSGFDSTSECAVAKLMFLLGQELTPKEIREHMQCSLIGEVTL